MGAHEARPFRPFDDGQQAFNKEPEVTVSQGVRLRRCVGPFGDRQKRTQITDRATKHRLSASKVILESVQSLNQIVTVKPDSALTKSVGVRRVFCLLLDHRKAVVQGTPGVNDQGRAPRRQASGVHWSLTLWAGGDAASRRVTDDTLSTSVVEGSSVNGRTTATVSTGEDARPHKPPVHLPPFDHAGLGLAIKRSNHRIDAASGEL